MTDIGRDRKELVTVPFDCNVLGGTAQLRLRQLVNPVVGKRQTIEFRCDNCDECGIGRQQGNSITYDWDRCPGHAQYGK